MFCKSLVVALLAAVSVTAQGPNFFDAASHNAVSQISDGQPQAPAATAAPAYGTSSSLKAPVYTSAKAPESTSVEAPVYTGQTSSQAVHSASAIAYHASEVAPSFTSPGFALPTSAASKYIGGAKPSGMITAADASGTGYIPVPGNNNTITLPTAPATTVINTVGGVTTVTAPAASATGDRSAASAVEFSMGAIVIAGLSMILFL